MLFHREVHIWSMGNPHPLAHTCWLYCLISLFPFRFLSKSHVPCAECWLPSRWCSRMLASCSSLSGAELGLTCMTKRILWKSWVWHPRVGLRSLGFLSPGETSYHAVRTLKMPYGDDITEKTWPEVSANLPAVWVSTLEWALRPQ